MRFDDFLSGLRSLAGSGQLEYRENVRLSELSTFRIGGICRIVIYPKNSSALRAVIQYAKATGVDYGIFGRCSNVLFSDKGWHGAIILTTHMKQFARKGNLLSAECGVLLGEFSQSAKIMGLSGAEFLFGIPGSIGGAVYMNAGAFGSSVSDIIKRCSYYSVKDNEVYSLKKEEMDLGYRDSIFMHNKDYIVLDAEFELTRGNIADISAKIKENQSKRRNTQPVGYPSAGSVFKRPGDISAGKLIEDAGLKGMRCNDAMISPKHAGFIVNDGNASAEEVIYLVKLIREKVLEMFGVRLETEIVLFGDWGD